MEPVHLSEVSSVLQYEWLPPHYAIKRKWRAGKRAVITQATIRVPQATFNITLPKTTTLTTLTTLTIPNEEVRASNCSLSSSPIALYILGDPVNCNPLSA